MRWTLMKSLICLIAVFKLFCSLLIKIVNLPGALNRQQCSLQIESWRLRALEDRLVPVVYSSCHLASASNCRRCPSYQPCGLTTEGSSWCCIHCCPSGMWRQTNARRTILSSSIVRQANAGCTGRRVALTSACRIEYWMAGRTQCIIYTAYCTIKHASSDR